MIPDSEKDNILMPNVINSGRSGDNVRDGIVMNGGLNLKDNFENRNNNNSSSSNLDGELELLMLQQQLQQQQLCNRELRIQRGRGLDILRSGSAPPTVEGALSSARSLYRNPNFEQLHESTSGSGHGRGSVGNGVPSEEEIRSHPAYLAYYYSNENHNPRLPPPLLSKEDWLVAQRVGSSIGAVGDWRSRNVVNDYGSSSLFSTQPGLSLQKAEDELIELRKAATSHGNLGTSGGSMGLRKKSFADIVQEGGGQPPMLEGSLSRPTRHNSFSDNLATSRITSARSLEFQNEAAASGMLHPGQMVKGLSGGKKIGSAPPEAFSSPLPSPSIRSRTHDPHLVGNSASPGLLNADPGMGRVARINVSGSRNLNGSGMNPIVDIADSHAGLDISKDQFHNKGTSLHSPLRMGISEAYPQDMQLLLGNSRAENLATGPVLVRENGNGPSNFNNSSYALNGQLNFPRRTYSSASLHSQGITSPQDWNSLNAHNYHPATGASFNGRSLRRDFRQAGSNLPPTLMDPRGIQNLHGSYNQKMNAGVLSGNPSQITNDDGIGHLQDFERLYLETLLAEQKQLGQSPLYVPSELQHQYHGNPGLDLCMPYQGNKVAHPVFPAVGSRTSTSQHKRMPHIASNQKHSIGKASWQTEAEANTGRILSTSLEEINNHKTKSLELSDVLGHVLEFSMDQYGSRRIQQKLETATVEEKMKIYLEIIPHARSLMTDVFGNYVIQKFFEHGTGSQRKELATQLIGHVLPLSLQMYGCRVIQKALEVVDVEQQTQMVAELDGSVMKCVRDQNGNHVVQKCIECVPQDRIQFIISSFFGQVVALSMHPYGCRVIQRVLEHCDDPKTQNIITGEIMHSICTLVQDQYGNYVIQHVLQHGKPHERSAIIRELAGQIVKMSQQKFASNVVEKCLSFGSPEERQLLVNEMLGTTDENEPLQAMMKDPFGNYVVQKVLETCNDESREHILSRIKVHLNALKKYTYGKHIVSRVEKLITTGERHKESSHRFSA